jgi:hypothetical protein
MAINTIQGFNPSTTEPIDSRTVVADSGSRFGIPIYNAYEGLLVFQKDTNELYSLIDTGSISSNGGWQLVGTGAGSTFMSTGSVTASVDATGDIFIIRSASYNPFTVSSTGLTTISGSAANLFLIKNASNQAVLTVSQSGVVILATSSIELTNTAPNGAIYFTSNALFVGLD